MGWRRRLLVQAVGNVKFTYNTMNRQSLERKYYSQDEYCMEWLPINEYIFSYLI